MELWVLGITFVVFMTAMGALLADIWRKGERPKQRKW